MKLKLKTQKWILLILLPWYFTASWAQSDTSPVQTVCAGIEPYLVTPTNGSIYTWTIAPGTVGQEWSINGTGNSINVDWRIPGVYTLTVSERNSAGCEGVPQLVTVTVTPGPTVDPLSDLAFCNGTATPVINFTGSVAGTTYSWTNSNTAIGLGAGGTGAVPSFIATNTGMAPISGTITVIPSANGCSGTPMTFTINVNPLPAPAIIGSGPDVCQSVNNNTEIYSTLSVPGNTYNWTVTGGTFTGQGTNQIAITWTTPGTGSVSVTETVGTIGCSASDTKVINIQPAPNTGPIFHN
jgi:PKD-like domain